MKRLLCVLLAVVAVVSTASVVVAAEDARPVILVLGARNCMPYRGSSSWVGLVRTQHPEWNVRLDADENRIVGETLKLPRIRKGKPAGHITYTGLLTDLDKVLKSHPAPSMVILFLGSNEARAEVYAKADAAQRGKDLLKLIAQIQAHPRSRNARIVVFTPMPVIDARLDKWSKDAFTNGEAHSDAIAAAFRQAAADADVPVVDVHADVKAWKGSDGKPGLLLGSIGWLMRDWGHPMFAKYIEPKIVALKPQPSDPAAYKEWLAARKANIELDRILSATCEGTVAHGKALQTRDETLGKNKGAVVEIPPAMLAGGTLDLLLTADPGKTTSVGPGSEDITKPYLTVQTNKGTVKIFSPGNEWQVIEETSPDKAVPPNKYVLNAGKARYFTFASSLPGKQAWTLIRFPLEDLAGRKVKSAKVTFRYCWAPNYASVMDDNKKVGPLPGPFGSVRVYPVTGRDCLWSNSQATWKTRDGKVGWTGGKVDKAARRAALEKFLAGDVPASVARRGKAALAELKN